VKKLLFKVFLLSALFFNISYGQAGVNLTSLPPSEATNYTTPLSTFLGTYFNSGGYYTAHVPSTFGFKLSIIGMYTFIPTSQQSFTSNPGIDGYSGEDTGTFFGGQGAVTLGPQGFAVYPFGFDASSIPSGIIQISGSLVGLEVMLRYFPKLKFNDVETGLLGIGVKYSISQFIPASPVDIAVQVLYNNLTFDYVGDVDENFFKSESKNIAVNAHASKTFSGMFTLYGGLQYESSTFDVEYYFRDPSGLYPDIADTNQKIEVEGDNNFRVTAGGAVKLAAIVFNVDFNVTSQFTIVGGISLEL
jgi:hypothetical protein